MPPAARTERRADEIDDGRDKWQRGSSAPVATRFGALGHDHVGTNIERRAGLIQVRHLDDQLDTRITNSVGEGARLAERQHDRVRSVLQSPLKRLGIKSPAQESDSPRAIGGSRNDL